MSDAIGIAAGGLATAFARFNSAAAGIAGNREDALPQIVALKQAQLEAEANLAVMRTATRMQKSLLDILA